MNKLSDNDKGGILITYWWMFRLVFVVFTLYLLGDAFSRWDGFSYYATFSEFIPSFSLAFILWSSVAVLTTFILMVGLKSILLLFKLTRFHVTYNNLFMYLIFLILTGSIIWKLKRVFFENVHTSVHIKIAVLVIIMIINIIILIMLNSKTDTWLKEIQYRITPLIWLFGLIFIISVIVVSYHTWFRNTEKASRNLLTSNIESNRKNIILISFDAMSARNMSVYGYKRDTTPFIKKWAKKATLFARTEAASNFTTPAVASLMTGKRVWTHRTFHVDGTKPRKSTTESLPAVLKEYGYFNIALIANPFASVSSLGMSNSFDIAPLSSEFGESASLFGWKFGIVDKLLYETFGEKIRMHNWILKNNFILSRVINLFSRNITQTTVPPGKAFDMFLDIAQKRPNGPFFAWIHLFPPHDPYLPPSPYIGMFNNSKIMRTYKEQERLIEKSYKYLFNNERFPDEMQPLVDLMRDYYDEFMRYCDKSFKDFITTIDKMKFDNTIIILTADHGESFEHGYFTHGGPFLYEQVTHIPLIIKDVEQTDGKIINNWVGQIDIAPTILELVNIPVPPWMEGRSLKPLIESDDFPELPVFSVNFQENSSMDGTIMNGTIAMWKNGFKLIYNLKNNEYQLYELETDPGEMINLLDSNHDKGLMLLKMIKSNLKIANERILSNN